MKHQKSNINFNYHDLGHLVNLISKTRVNNSKNMGDRDLINSDSFISEQSLGLKSLKRKYDIPENNKKVLDLIFDKLLKNYQILISDFFRKYDNYNESISDFLKEMSREIVYCQVHKIKYNQKDLYNKAFVTLTESTLNNQSCPVCNKKIQTCRSACTDLFCFHCQLKFEVKSKKNTDNNKWITVNSGIPEGVTEWKNTNGKLIIFKEDGYFIIDSNKVQINGYIHNLDINWSTDSNYKLNTKRKTKISFRKENLGKFYLKYNFKWSDYTIDIALFLNKLIKYLNINQSKFNHLKSIENAINDFEKIIIYN